MIKGNDLEPVVGPSIIYQARTETLQTLTIKNPHEKTGASAPVSKGSFVHYESRLRRSNASPARPKPINAMDEGSGTGDGLVGSIARVVRIPKVNACQYSLFGMVHENVE